MRSLILKHLTRFEIARITKLIGTFGEIEYLTEGFCEALQTYAEKQQPLQEDDCDYLKRKVVRIESLINVMPEKINKLSELLLDYAGILGPSYVTIPPIQPNETSN
jgi:hypothetical protein